ncbi:MAG: hypothetical protein AAFR61_31555, partial [Bacteroidota bacterium]
MGIQTCAISTKLPADLLSRLNADHVAVIAGETLTWHYAAVHAVLSGKLNDTSSAISSTSAYAKSDNTFFSIFAINIR